MVVVNVAIVIRVFVGGWGIWDEKKVFHHPFDVFNSHFVSCGLPKNTVPFFKAPFPMFRDSCATLDLT